jgi:hypothetical protein
LVFGPKLARKSKPERLRARVWQIDKPVEKVVYNDAA